MRRWLRHWWQRRTRGFDDSELWGLDDTAMRWFYPRLKAFREMDRMGVPLHPIRLDEDGNPDGFTEDEWNAILDEILAALKLYVEDDYYSTTEEYQAGQKQIHEGLKLLGVWFRALWD